MCCIDVSCDEKVRVLKDMCELSVVNNIMIKYRHPIPILVYMLYEFHGSYIFTKLIWKMFIIKLEWNKVMDEKLLLRLNMSYMKVSDVVWSH